MRRIRHAIDALFCWLRGESEHCLMAHAYDRDRLPEPTSFLLHVREPSAEDMAWARKRAEELDLP